MENYMENSYVARPGGVYFEAQFGSDGSLTSQGFQQQPGLYHYHQVSNVSPTQFRTRKPKILVPNEFHYVIRDGIGLLGKYNEYYSNGRISLLRDGHIGAAVSGDVLGANDMLISRQTIYNECVEKLNEKIRGSLDLSVDAFQFRQTSKMFTALTPRRLTRMLIDTVDGGHLFEYRDDKRGRPRLRRVPKQRDWRNAFKTPSNLYLQWKYGWNPLMTSVYDAVGLNLELADDYIKSYSASIVKPTPGSFSYKSSPVETTAGAQVNGVQVCKIGVRIDGKLFDPSSVDKYTSLNPLSIGYELIPFSFVLDWFVDIGSFLRSVESGILNRRSFIDGYAVEMTAYDIINYYVTKQFKYPNGYDMRGQIKYVKYDRRVLNSPPVPYLPQFRMDLGSSRLLSAAALISQLFL
jgi:hypothetical protein